MPYKRTGRPTGRPKIFAETEVYSVSGPLGLRDRARKVAAELSMTHGQLVDFMLRQEEKRIERERERQVSPLHRPRAQWPVAGYTD